MKKTYYVNYSVICRYTVKVEAENEERATELANQEFETADFWVLEYGDHQIEIVEE